LPAPPFLTSAHCIGTLHRHILALHVPLDGGWMTATSAATSALATKAYMKAYIEAR
jgi:hypothetical protein